MNEIRNNLYQFTTYIPPLDFSIHQYVLATNPVIVFATGTNKEAEENLPKIKEILAGKPVKYIFISHLESDECGGLIKFWKEYPQAVVLCSALCSRELSGYGYAGKVKVCNHDEYLNDGDLRLRFFNYPAEIHLQNGLLCFEENSGIFYSSDLMLRYGNGTGKIIRSDWKTEIESIDFSRIPNKEFFCETQKVLSTIAPKFIAVGHGFCITL